MGWREEEAAARWLRPAGTIPHPSPRERGGPLPAGEGRRRQREGGGGGVITPAGAERAGEPPPFRGARPQYYVVLAWRPGRGDGSAPPLRPYRGCGRGNLTPSRRSFLLLLLLKGPPCQGGWYLAACLHAGPGG